jgi:nitroreductase
MNETYRRILRLRAIRNYDDRPLAEGDLHAVLEAARWTGSSKNQQRWSFVVVDDPEKKDALARCGSFTTPIREAPVVVAIVREPGGYEFDTGRVAQNMMLAADAIGLATCPITLHRDDQAAEVLELPAGAHCRYAVAVGYPASGAGPARMGGRKPIEELVHRNRY